MKKKSQKNNVSSANGRRPFNSRSKIIRGYNDKATLYPHLVKNGTISPKSKISAENSTGKVDGYVSSAAADSL